jgi:hypothetical protein
MKHHLVRPLRWALLIAAALEVSVAGFRETSCRRHRRRPASAAISIYGAWHCSDDYCTWGHVRTVAR